MEKEIAPIEFSNEYLVLGADLSLKRPSFAMLSLKKINGKTEIVDVVIKTVDNKTDKKKTHGQLLSEIMAAFTEIAPFFGNFYAVREAEIMNVKVPSERSLSKVVGIMDYKYWMWCQKEWFSIYPVTIKKLITGSGKATKEEVAKALTKYVGKIDYKCDDESDAVAVAVAWLIQQGEIEAKNDG